MSIFGDMFSNKKHENASHQKIRKIMGQFCAASFIGVDPKLLNGHKHSKAFLMYMFGATDMISQAHGLTTGESVELFESLLQGTVSHQTQRNAKECRNMACSESSTQSGMAMMREGGDALKYWIQGVTLAPHRLQEILSEIEE